MSELNLKHEAKRYGCAVLAAMIMALNIKTFVRAGGLFPGGFTGLTLLIQNIFQTFVQPWPLWNFCAGFVLRI